MRKFAGTVFFAFFIRSILPVSAQSPLERIQADSIKAWVMQLSHDSMQGRLTGTVGAEKAIGWLEGKFAEAGLQPLAGNDGYLQFFQVETGSQAFPSANVMGLIPAAQKTDTFYLFFTHYDHMDAGSQDESLYMGSRITDWVGKKPSIKQMVRTLAMCLWPMISSEPIEWLKPLLN